MPKDEALGDSAAPIQRIKGGVKVRKAVLKAKSLRARMPARQRVKTRRPRKSAASAHVSVLAKRLKWLEEYKLPKAQQSLALTTEAVATLRADFTGLPLIQRARFFSAPVVAAIGIVVIAYDVVILRAALEHAGFGLHHMTLTYAAIATPLAIMAINSVLGVLAGAIALHVPSRERLQLAVAAIIAGGGALVVTFVLLAVFRAEATSGHNGLLRALTHHETHPKTVLVPWWFAPLQLAGSIAAICSVAMYSAGDAGRDLRELITKAQNKLEKLEGMSASVEAEVEHTRREIEAGTIAVHEIDVDAEGAEIEVQTAGEALRAELDAEDGLEESVIGDYSTSFTSTAKIFQNGRVWRVALPTIAKRFNRFYTPPPGDTERPVGPTPPHTNGSGHLTPEEQEQLTFPGQ